MFTLPQSEFQRIAVSAIGAVLLTATCVIGAAAPVRAASLESLPAWTAAVQSRVAAVPASADQRLRPATLRSADVALRFTADGRYAGASLARSSGDGAIDAEAVKVANRVRYPRLPESVRGHDQEVALKLYFGDAVSGVTMPASAPRMQVARTANATRFAQR